MILPSSDVLHEMPIGSSDLLVGDRQILILVGGEGSPFIDVAFLSFLVIVFLDDRLGFSPAYEIEEALGLESQLESSLHLDAFEDFLLSGDIGIRPYLHRHAVFEIIVIDSTCALRSAGSTPSCASASARMSITSAYRRTIRFIGEPHHEPLMR